MKNSIIVVGLVLLVAGVALAQPVRDTFWLVMDDSVRIDCTRFTPQGTPPPGGFPGIVFVHGLGGSKTGCEPTAQTYAGYGYVTLAYSVRGQGRSTGRSTLFSWRERRDLAAIVDWLAAQASVNDTLLAVQGMSQGAFHAWYAGIDNLPGVRAVQPDNAVPHKEESFAYRGCYNYTIIAEMNNSSTVRIDTITVPLRRLMRADKYDSVVMLVSDGRSFDSTQVAASSAAYMFGGAWHDHCFYHTRYPGTLNIAPPHSIMYLGTGIHGSEPSQAELNFRDTLRQRFFAERLKGQYRGLDTVGPWIFALGPSWRHLEFTSWPPPGQSYYDFWLHSDGSLTEEPPNGSDSFTMLEHQRTNPAYTWDSAVTDLFANVRHSFSRYRVAFRTAPLGQAVTLLGVPWADAWFKGPAPKKQLTLQVYDEPPSGAPTYLTQISLGVRDNPDSTVWDNVAGEMAPIGWDIPAGHRLRVDWCAINVTMTDTSVWWLPFWDADGWLTLGVDTLHPARISIPMLGMTGKEEDVTHDAGRRRPEVYPNPSQGLVRFYSGVPGQRPWSRLIIRDVSGRAVRAIELGRRSRDEVTTRVWADLDLRALAAGVYFAASADCPSECAKIILKR